MLHLNETANLLGAILPFGILIVVFYFLLIRPQKKKDRNAQEMRNAVQIGDEVITVGGIIGIVVSLKEDSLVIETAGERNKIRVKRWAIQSNETIRENTQ